MVTYKDGISTCCLLYGFSLYQCSVLVLVLSFVSMIDGDTKNKMKPWTMIMLLVLK